MGHDPTLFEESYGISYKHCPIDCRLLPSTGATEGLVATRELLPHESHWTPSGWEGKMKMGMDKLRNGDVSAIAKSSLILGENKAAFSRDIIWGHP